MLKSLRLLHYTGTRKFCKALPLPGYEKGYEIRKSTKLRKYETDDRKKRSSAGDGRGFLWMSFCESFWVLVAFVDVPDAALEFRCTFSKRC